jgi:methionine sulfoxide reductase heme-binding subunit
VTDTLWYLGRGTGVTALILLTVSMVLGVGARSGRGVFGLPRTATQVVHRDASLIAVLLTLVHMVTLLADPYALLRLVDLLVPFTSRYRPVWTGLGAVAVDLLIAVLVTSAIRRRLTVRTWQAVHLTAYLCWPVAWLHGIGDGTDRGSGWYLVVSIVCALAVAAAVAWRLSPGFVTLGGRRLPRRSPSGAGR